MLALGVLAAAADQVTGVLGDGPAPDAIEARRMQALSLAVHIPIVCFGIAFPAMILFVHGLYLRTGEPHYKALAKRWSKVALVLFAVGVVTGTILSFEFGLLWPDFMATFGEVFGVAFGLEGISFFVEAIFIAIYVYGWDRLPPRTHFLTGIPVVVSGFIGSFCVIAVNGWMNQPRGFEVRDGEVVDPAPWSAMFNSNLWHELIHMYVAGYLVAGFIVAGVYAHAHLRGRRDAYHRTGLVVALSFAALAAPVQLVIGDWAGRAVTENQPVKLAAIEGLPTTTKGAAFTVGGWYDADTNEMKGGIEIPKLLSLLADHNPDGTVQGLDTVPRDDRPPVNIVHYSFQVMVGIGTGLALLARALDRDAVAARPAPPLALVLPGGDARGAGRARRADRGLDHDGGRPPAVDRLRGHARGERGHGSDGLEAGFVLLVAVYLLLAVAVAWLLRRLAASSPASELPAQEVPR